MMKFDVGLGSQSLSLSSAILIYGESSPYGSDLAAFATVHEVDCTGGKPRIQPGRPLNEGDFSTLVKGLAPKERPAMEWQDATVLARGMGRVIWWTPAMMRPMFFKKTGHESAIEGQGMCPVPAMVWQGTATELFVYAIKGTDRPTIETELYQAPFFNVWEQGRVCNGNAVLPAPERRGDTKEWEKTFFGSFFTHANVYAKDRLIVGKQPSAFWREMLKKQPKKFPERVLAPLEKKVADLLPSDFVSRLGARTRQGEN